MPLLGATLIAIIAFLPIFLSPDTAGVYTRDLFIVLAVSLLLSWVLALVHVPLMANRKLHPAVEVSATGKREYKGRTYALLRTALYFGLAHRWSVVLAMLALLGLSIFATATCGRVSSPIWCTTSSTWSTSCPKAITPPAWHAI